MATTPPGDLLGITPIDWLVILGYLLGITALGIWTVRMVKSSTSFFISERKFGSLMMMFFNFGTGTHSDQAVGVAAKTFHVGASGMWYQLLWLFSTPLYWVIAPMFRRMRAVTTSDFFEARFDRSVAVLYAVVAIMNLVVNIAVMLKGSSAMITAVTGGAIDPFYAVMAMTVMFVTYGVAGGLNAAVVTDLIQGIMTIVLSFIILPFALWQVGGMTGLRLAVNNPNMFELVTVGGEITVFYVAIISINGLIGYGTQPHTMSLCAAGRTEMQARVGMTCGMFIKRFCTVAWVLTGLCAVALYGAHKSDPGFDVDHVYGLMAGDLLPAVMPGLVGLFIASMLAAVMSSCDAFMVASSALFTENVYRKLLVKDAPDRHYMLVGRVASIFVVIAGILFAFSLSGVIEGLEVFWKISAMMGLAFWAGLFWRKTTPAGAWAGTLSAFAALLFTSEIKLMGSVFWNFNDRFAERLPEFMVYADPANPASVPQLYLPWQMIIYLSVGLVILVIVSLLTRPVSEEQLERFYGCLRTPVGPDEPETEPFTLPPGVEPPPRRVLIDIPGFEIPMPTFVGVAGVVVTAGVVGVFIWGVYWIFSLGA
jgi:Na+/proline symporter